MALKKIHKLLYYDTERERYFFIRGKEVKELVHQEAYLQAYIIELLKELRELNLKEQNDSN